MSLSPIHTLISRFSPTVRVVVAYAPIARVERTLDLLGAAPDHPVSYRTSAAAALSGPDAASTDQSPPLPVLAPGARFDASA